jgi:hypothetical protein
LIIARYAGNIMMSIISVLIANNKRRWFAIVIIINGTMQHPIMLRYAMKYSNSLVEMIMIMMHC